MGQPLKQGFEPGTMFDRKSVFTHHQDYKGKKMRWGERSAKEDTSEIKKYRNEMKVGRTQAELDLEGETETRQKGVLS